MKDQLIMLAALADEASEKAKQDPDKYEFYMGKWQGLSDAILVLRGQYEPT